MSADKPAAPRRLLRKALLPLVVLVIGVLAARWIMDSAPQAGRRPPPERQARLVEVATVQPASRPVIVQAFGEVRPAREVVLRAQTAGRVVAIHPDLVPGGRLEQDAVAVEIERRDYELQLQQARGELARAQAELALERGQQAVARREFELLGQQASEEERRLMLREPQLRTAEGSVAAAQAAVAAAELALERTRLRAPFDALVVARGVAPGSTVGTSTDVATLVGTERWWVEVAVPVAALRWIELPTGKSPGSRVRLYDDAAWGKGRYREGQVVRRQGALEEQGRMARLLVEVDDPLALEASGTDRPELLIGAFLRAEIHGRALDNAIALDPAWLRDGDRAWVMNAQDRLEFRPLEVAYRGAGQVLVTGGLEAGARVVTSAIASAVEGMPLRLRGEPTAQPRGEQPHGR